MSIYKLRILLLFSLLSQNVFAVTATKPIDLSSERAKLSYTLGIDLGLQFQRKSLNIDPEILAKGLQDSMQQNNYLLSKEEMASIMLNFHKNLKQKAEEEFKQLAQENARMGKEFLMVNGKRPGINTLPSGLQYRVIKVGKGLKPLDTDTVTVNYIGKLLNGQVFDSSYKSGSPISFTLTDVISGWAEALKLMNMGAEWEIYIPPELAYGENGLSSTIGPNETLIFRIELLNVTRGKKS